VRAGPVALLLLLVCCSATPPDPLTKPEGPDSALIAVRVRAVHPPGERLHGSIRAAWFVRFEEGRDPADGGDVVRSNYWDGGIVYLLNAKPGYYALVTVEERSEGMNIPTYLTTESIREYSVEVAPGSWAMMGNYTVHQARDLRGLDASQRYFRYYSNPPAKRKSGLSSMFGGIREYRGDRVEVDRGPGTLDAQRRQAIESLGDGGWVSPPR
jgi:hypothetical protein